MSEFLSLPEELPVPIDDGAANHLTGLKIPSIALMGTSGELVKLNNLGAGRTILYVYPRTGTPGVEVPDSWNSIPGARGCTQESCGFRDLYSELKKAGVAEIFGMSNQDSDYQFEVVQRLHLPFQMLSDLNGELGGALKLPSFDFENTKLYARLTMVIHDSVIEKVFYPVFPPDSHSQDVLNWLKEN